MGRAFVKKARKTALGCNEFGGVYKKIRVCKIGVRLGVIGFLTGLFSMRLEAIKGTVFSGLPLVVALLSVALVLIFKLYLAVSLVGVAKDENKQEEFEENGAPQE